MAVWEAEREHGLLRSELLPPVGAGSTNGEPETPASVCFYCRICLVTFSSQESFENHCSSVEHVHMLSADSSVQWVHRAPPLGLTKFTLCSRAEVCEMGNSCTKAHSEEELQEWIQRVKVSAKKKRQALKDGLLSYQDRLLAEYRTCSNEVLIHVEGVQVVCEQPLQVQLEDRKKKYQWKFKVHSQVSSVFWKVFFGWGFLLFLQGAEGQGFGHVEMRTCVGYSGSAQVVPALGLCTQSAATVQLLLLGERAFPGPAVHPWGARGHRVLLAPCRAGGGQHGVLHPGRLRAVGGV
uniref:C2H2-type domain-containing protein n=1 Tax=Malurus cyaneus samueli TaxID=2593467 RepID=A0A8C5U4E7_9PASS